MKDCCGKTSMPAFKLVSKRGFASRDREERERERDHRHTKTPLKKKTCDCNSPAQLVDVDARETPHYTLSFSSIGPFDEWLTHQSVGFSLDHLCLM